MLDGSPFVDGAMPMGMAHYCAPHLVFCTPSCSNHWLP